ncbi:MAG: hypothetical protein R6Y91_08825 [Desulfohalobium sp.]
MIATVLRYTLCFCLCWLALPLSGLAQNNDASFAQWLQEYGAYDVLGQELAKQSPTPKTVFKRVRLALQRGEAEQARSLLDSYGPFDSSSAEGERLWLLGQAARLQQQWVQALLQYSQAGTHWDEESIKERFTSEPDMEFFWENTWKLWFWGHFNGVSPLANQGQRQLLLQAASHGQTVWPENAFWKDILQLWPESDWEAVHSFSLQDHSFSVAPVAKADQNAVLQAMAAMSLGRDTLVSQTVQDISATKQRQFWDTVTTSLQNAEMPDNATTVDPSDHPKRQAFWHLFQTEIAEIAKQGAHLSHPKASFWKPFYKTLSTEDPRNALQRIERELDSSLLSDSLVQSLHRFALGYALLAEMDEAAQHHWEAIEPHSLPLSLRLAAFLADFGSTQDLFPPDAGSVTQGQVLAALANAGGKNPAPLLTAPFWIQFESSEQLKEAAAQWPLDKGLAYSTNAFQRETADTTTTRPAKRLAFLFPQTQAGQEAILALARQAHENTNPQHAWRYVKRLKPKDLFPSQQVPYWQAKAGLEMELGREEAALDSYQTLLEMAPEEVDTEKRLKLALLAQRKDRWDWAQSQLRALWSEKDKLSKALQAETLFWIGEGWQYKNKNEKALATYLRLAYSYPEQNIWAVTAMYRAALLYEQNKQFAPAAKLLQEVVTRADRESQKEAAQDRLEGIRSQTAQQSSEKETLEFIF